MVDYCKMWKDLNMDLETPDQLCKCCPTQAFGAVYFLQKNQLREYSAKHSQHNRQTRLNWVVLL